MPEHKKAVVIGALGVIGRYIVERLLQDGWSVDGPLATSSRSRAALSPRQRRPARCRGHGREARRADRRDARVLRGVSAGGGWRGGLCGEHRAQPRHAGQCGDGDRCGVGGWPSVLVTGTKSTASTSAPKKRGARERPAPRGAGLLLRPDRLAHRLPARQALGLGRMRPQTLCGFAPGTPMSRAGDAVYAAISRELGAAAFPGQAEATRRYQVTESALRGRGAVGGDRAALCTPGVQHHQRRLFPLAEMWPRIAAVFDMPVGAPHRSASPPRMPDQAPLWHTMVEKHGLKPFAYKELVAGRLPTTCSAATGT